MPNTHRDERRLTMTILYSLLGNRYCEIMLNSWPMPAAAGPWEPLPAVPSQSDPVLLSPCLAHALVQHGVTEGSTEQPLAIDSN